MKKKGLKARAELKLLGVVFLVVISATAFMFLASKFYSKHDNNSNSALEKVQIYDSKCIFYRDKVTDVLFMHNRVFVELHDPETGLPLTYKRYKELEKQKTEEDSQYYLYWQTEKRKMAKMILFMTVMWILDAIIIFSIAYLENKKSYKE